ncbi:hypothetical protein LTR85_002531 [Meristemomyces frigidus]|nr:hypothetical protein LTR85_002531 [Meristemomyces frigidus]
MSNKHDREPNDGSGNASKRRRGPERNGTVRNAGNAYPRSDRRHHQQQRVPQNPNLQDQARAHVGPPSPSSADSTGLDAATHHTTLPSSVLATVSTDVQSELQHSTSEVFGQLFPHMIDTMTGLRAPGFIEQCEALLPVLLQLLPLMSEEAQKSVVDGVIKTQVLPFLAGYEHQPQDVEHTNGIHCSQLHLKQGKAALAFLPGLTVLLWISEKYEFSRRLIERFFLEHQMCIAYLQSRYMHEEHSYEVGWRCGGCLKENEIMPADLIRFMHHKACGNPAAGGLSLKKFFSMKGTDYTEDHYGFVFGFVPTPGSVIKKIVPATSFTGNVWTKVRNDPELMKHLVLLWPIELGEPTDLPEGMRFWYTRGVTFAKPTFLGLRQTVDADEDVVMHKIDGELASLEECKRAQADIEGAFQQFTEQLTSACAQRSAKGELELGGIAIGAEPFMRGTRDPQAVFEELIRTHGEESGEDAENVETHEVAETVNRTEQVEDENEDRLEECDDLGIHGASQHVESSDEAKEPAVFDNPYCGQALAYLTNSETGEEPDIDLSEDGRRLIDGAGPGEGDDLGGFGCTELHDEAHQLIGSFDTTEHPDGHQESEPEATSQSVSPSLSGSTLVPSVSFPLDDDTVTKAVRAKSSAFVLQQGTKTTDSSSSYVGGPVLSTATRGVFSLLDISTAESKEQSSGLQIPNGPETSKTQLPSIEEEDDPELMDLLNGVCDYSKTAHDQVDAGPGEVTVSGASLVGNADNSGSSPSGPDQPSESGGCSAHLPSRNPCAYIPPGDRLFDDDETSLYEAY